jgi:dATP pyrophosphohydrolase
VLEETGIDSRHDAALANQLTDWHLENVYEIYPNWRHRYAAHVTHNTEHLFGLRVPKATRITLAPREHTEFTWLPYREAAQRCYSASNAEACLLLPRFANAVSAR